MYIYYCFYLLVISYSSIFLFIALSICLGEYLNMLGNVREKLSALYIILYDYSRIFGFLEDSNDDINNSSHSASHSINTSNIHNIHHMHNIKNNIHNNQNSHSISIKNGINTIISSSSSSIFIKSSYNNNNNNSSNNIYESMDFAITNEENGTRITSAGTKIFLQEQVTQVFNGYLYEYFQKEFTHIKFQYHRVLTKAINDHPSTTKYVKKAVTSATVLSSLPLLKAEKLKSISNIERSVGNLEFIDTVFLQSSDSLSRITNIARDDKRLSSTIKDLYILHMKFLYENIFIPITTTSTILLLRSTSAIPHTSTLPPVELLKILGCLLTTIERNKIYFSQFQLYMRDKDGPNHILICQEMRKRIVTLVKAGCRESLVAWGVCVCAHLDKVLLSLQSKHDFKPDHEDDFNLPLINDGELSCYITYMYVYIYILCIMRN